jgi:alkanesulfonate monooxygenase SsuD/methylene tetrahydromethanopterin reductase-like flavin-dependent oxidoreductase (luciferase family)
MEFGIFDHLDRNDSSPADFFRERLRMVEEYERLGFYAYHAAEHHSTPLGLAPSPSVYMASIAQRTKRLRFGPLVYLLPFYHPLRLIEEICMLDHLSDGRFQLGVGRGISPIEAGYYGLDANELRDTFDESLKVVLKGLTSTRLTHHGDRYRFDNVPIEVSPLQKPHPPLWMGVQTPASASTAGARGINIVSLLPAAAMRPIVEAYRAESKPRAGSEPKIGTSYFIFVAETDRAAMTVAERAYRRWHESFHYLYQLHGRDPVFGVQPQSFADIIRANRGIAGSAETVAEFLHQQSAESGINYIVGQFVFGDMSQLEAQQSVRMFAEHVIPQFAQEHKVASNA